MQFSLLIFYPSSLTLVAMFTSVEVPVVEGQVYRSNFDWLSRPFHQYYYDYYFYSSEVFYPQKPLQLVNFQYY